MSSPSYGKSIRMADLLRPKLIPTLFPRLPRDSHRSYRLALGLGSAAVDVLAALRLFPGRADRGRVSPAGAGRAVPGRCERLWG